MKIYGIKNCDTMKKAVTWLQDHGLDYEFIDYKLAGIAAQQLPHWVEQAGWETLLNRRGLTWKKLTDAQRTDLDEMKAIKLMQDYPSMIKRPVLVTDEFVLVGFAPDTYQEKLLSSK